MWFLFGIITLTVSIIILSYQRYKGLWDGSKVIVDGKELIYHYHGSRSGTRYILIGLDAPRELRFLIKKEKWWDRLFKRIKVSVEFQTGEKGFDDNYYLVADSILVHKLMTLETAQKKIDAIEHLAFDNKLKLNCIECRGGRLWIKLIPIDKKEEFDYIELSKQFFSDLNWLSILFEKGVNWFPKKSKDHYIIKTIVLLGISTGLLCFGTIYSVKLFFGYIPFTIDLVALNLLSFFVATIVIFCLIILAIFMLRGSSRLHLVLLEMITIGYFGAYGSALVLMRDLNIDFDQSNKKEIVATVFEKKSTRIRRCIEFNLTRRLCRRYSIHVYADNWNNKRTIIRVGYDFYGKVKVGNTLKIYQREGLLGIKWVSDLKIAN